MASDKTENSPVNNLTITFPSNTSHKFQLLAPESNQTVAMMVANHQLDILVNTGLTFVAVIDIYSPFKLGTHRPAACTPGFLKLILCGSSVCVCVSAPRLLVTSGAMWHDMDPIQLVKQVIKLLHGNCSHYR